MFANLFNNNSSRFAHAWKDVIQNIQFSNGFRPKRPVSNGIKKPDHFITDLLYNHSKYGVVGISDHHYIQIVPVVSEGTNQVRNEHECLPQILRIISMDKQ